MILNPIYMYFMYVQYTASMFLFCITFLMSMSNLCRAGRPGAQAGMEKKKFSPEASPICQIQVSSRILGTDENRFLNRT